MQTRLTARDLEVDLEGGVVPISKAASALAALLKQARERRRPIIVTQKGYPSGVILDVELYAALRALAEAASAGGPPQEGPAPEVRAAEPAAAEPAPARKGRGGRRRAAPGGG